MKIQLDNIKKPKTAQCPFVVQEFEILNHIMRFKESKFEKSDLGHLIPITAIELKNGDLFPLRPVDWIRLMALKKYKIESVSFVLYSEVTSQEYLALFGNRY